MVFSMFSSNISIFTKVQLQVEKEKFNRRFNRLNLRLMKLLPQQRLIKRAKILMDSAHVLFDKLGRRLSISL